MDQKPPSPRISRLSWGQIEVAGHRAFKDAKLYPGGAREWDWRETGTRHVPGIQPADVAELLEHGAEVVVLSKGVLERLQVCPETLELLQRRGLPAHVRPSEVALRVKALESLLIEKGLVDPAALDALIETYEHQVGPHRGARVVARAASTTRRSIA